MADEAGPEARDRRRDEIAARLGRRRVWFVDDPEIMRVLEEPRDLATLEFIRAAGVPVPLARLVEAGHVEAGASSERLDRLERSGLVEYWKGPSGAGYLCVDPIFTFVYDPERPVPSDVITRYRSMIRRHNDSVEEAAGAEADRSPYFDRILRVNRDQLARIDQAISRVAAEARQAEEASARRRPEDDDRGPLRLQVAVTHLPLGTETLAPIYFMDLSYEHAESVMTSAADRLTPRQQEVAAFIISGRSNAMIAQELGVSENTVKSSIREIYRRLEVDTRADLVRVLTA